jgi:hypothetical protein
MDAPYDTLIEFAKEHPDSNLGKAVRSAQSQARDEALETAAKEAEAYWVEFEHRRGSAEELVCYDLAERFRALKASKP